MIRPLFLNKGSKVGFLSPAGIVYESKIEHAISIMHAWGLDVIRGKYLYEKHNFFAGTDEQRIEDFQNMLDDSEIRAIFCSRGGYGVIKMIGRLNFRKFLKSPKWIVGYSDVTIFHTFFNKHLQCESLHGIMPNNFQKANDDGSLGSLKKALFGDTIIYVSDQNKLNKTGKESGKLVGGNLSIIYSLQGTGYEIDTKNNILFIEDINEDIYHIDRMMTNLKLSGKLDKLKGLIIGRMTKIRDTVPDFGKSAYEVISDTVAEFHYPVIHEFQAGHSLPNLALYMGRELEIEVTTKHAILKFI